MKVIQILVFTVVLVLGVTSMCLAQTTQGEIRGTVVDEAGAVVPGASITVTSIEKSFVRTAVSNGQGFYSVPHLEPGDYRLAVEKEGFLRFVQERVRLESRAQVRIDAPLTIGEVNEQIIVDVRTPVIETETGRISDVVEYRTLRDVTMNGRGVSSWYRLTPGAFSGNGGTLINGSRGFANGLTLDGAPVGEKGYDGNTYASLRPDQESIREIRVDFVNNSAEFGRMATVSQTSVNGRNEFHGQASYVHKNAALDARNFFAANRPPGVLVHHWYASVGGPVWVPRLYNGRSSDHRPEVGVKKLCKVLDSFHNCLD
jgi:hypothetical protein